MQAVLLALLIVLLMNLAAPMSSGEAGTPKKEAALPNAELPANDISFFGSVIDVSSL